MTTIPIASHCSANAAPLKTSQSCVDMQAETGELFTCPRQHNLIMVLLIRGAVTTTPTISSNETSSSESDEETAPQVIIPKERLPDVFVVHNIET
jgi:hypothetical protein